MQEGILFLYDHTMQGDPCHFACLGRSAEGCIYRDIKYIIRLEQKKDFDIPKCLCSVQGVDFLFFLQWCRLIAVLYCVRHTWMTNNGQHKGAIWMVEVASYLTGVLIRCLHRCFRHGSCMYTLYDQKVNCPQSHHMLTYFCMKHVELCIQLGY